MEEEVPVTVPDTPKIVEEVVEASKPQPPSSSSPNKIGDNSVVSQVFLALQNDNPDFTYSYSTMPFYNSVDNLLQRRNVRVVYEKGDHGYKFTGTVNRLGLDGQLMPVPPTHFIMSGFYDEVRLTTPLVIAFTHEVAVGSLSPDAFGSLATGGIVNSRLVSSKLSQYFNDPSVQNLLASGLNVDITRYQNSALYAKGLFYSLLVSRINQESIVTRVAPHLEADIIQVDVNQKDDILDIENSIQGGRFTVMVGHDFWPDRDLQNLLWLASPGRRLAPAGVECLGAMCIEWPGIPFTILRRGGKALIIPPAKKIQPQLLWQFTRDLATKRAERDMFVVGAYKAAALIYSELWVCHQGAAFRGKVMNRPDTDRNTRQLMPYIKPAQIPADSRRYAWHTPVTPLLETFGYLTMSRPFDSSVLQRYCQIFRKEEPTYLNDNLAFTWASFDQRLLGAAVYSCFHSVCVTTSLATFNTYGLVIQQNATMGLKPPDMFSYLANNFGWLKNTDQNEANRANVYNFTFRLVDSLIGGNSPPGSFAYRSWNVPDRPWGFPEGPFALNSPHHPPRMGSPLVLLGWVARLPPEWGIFDNAAQIDFTKETLAFGPNDNFGWYGINGESKYIKYAKGGNEPYSLLPYGSLAMNAISQAYQDFLPPGAPPFQWYQIPWNKLNENKVFKVSLHPHPPVFNDDYRIFEPCTVMTYDWAKQALYAPILIAQNLPSPNNYNIFVTMSRAPCNDRYSRGFILAAAVVPDSAKTQLCYAMPKSFRRRANPQNIPNN